MFCVKIVEFGPVALEIMKMWKVYNDFEDIDAKTANKFPSGKVLFNYLSSIIVRGKFKVLIEEEGKDDPTKKVSAPIFNAYIMSIC